MRGHKSKLIGEMKLLKYYPKKCLWVTLVSDFSLVFWFNGDLRTHNLIFDKCKKYLNMDFGFYVTRAGSCITTFKIYKKGSLTTIKKLIKILENKKICKNIKWDLINKEFSKKVIDKIKVVRVLEK